MSNAKPKDAIEQLQLPLLIEPKPCDAAKQYARPKNSNEQHSTNKDDLGRADVRSGRTQSEDLI